MQHLFQAAGMLNSWPSRIWQPADGMRFSILAAAHSCHWGTDEALAQKCPLTAKSFLMMTAKYMLLQQHHRVEACSSVACRLDSALMLS